MFDTGVMTTTDYLVNALFIGLVVLQVRGKRLTTFSLLVPLAVMAGVAHTYLHGIPTAGDNLVLVVFGAAVGLMLGVGCGMATAVFRDARGDPFAKAGLVAAVLWVLGIGARLAFTLYASHGGQGAIERFSVAHHITSGQAWVACLILMAAAEVAGRTVVLAVRRRAIVASGLSSAAIGRSPMAAAAMMGARERQS